MFSLRLFGGASLLGAGEPVSGPPAQRHRLALLSLLATAPGGTVSRDRLIALLWPENTTERARRLLNVSVHTLRRTLGEESLVSAGDDLRLDPARVSTDVGEFAGALERGDRERAVSLYAGPFLDGFFLSGAAEFNRWAEGERDRLAGSCLDALEALAEDSEQRGEVQAAARWWKRLAAQAPLNTRIALRLMRALDAAGDRAGALRHARVYAVLYREEIGTEPDPEVLALAERLRREPAAREEPLPVSPPAPPEESAAPGRERYPATGPVAVPGTPDAAPPQGIAVLPFEDDTRGRRSEYFSDGLTEEITNALSRIRGLRVVARTSAFAFRGRQVGTPEIGQKLGVSHLLEGSVRKSAKRLRITVRLVEAASGVLLWSGRYDREIGDIFQVQDEIARSVVEALRVELVGERGDGLVRSSTADAEAYTLYLKGRHAWYRRTPVALEESIGYFERARERDPGYALAHIGLADAYNMLGAFDYGVLPPGEIYPRAIDAAVRGLALRPDLAEGHAALANALLNYEWDWSGAERAFRRAIQLNPGYAVAYHWYSLYLVVVGRHAEALAAAERARELDPMSLVMGAALARQLYYQRRYERSIREYRSTLSLEPGFVTARLGLGVTLAMSGALEEAVAEYQAVLSSPESPRPVALALLGHAYGLAGREPEAREILARLQDASRAQYVPPECLALLSLGLDETDAAFAWLERAYEQRSGSLLYLRVEPILDPIRSDARFLRLQARVGLPVPPTFP